MSGTIEKAITTVVLSLGAREEIMRIRLGQGRGSRADYYTRYKFDLATLDGSGTQASNWRCVVVNVSSNTGAATIDGAFACKDVPDLVPFPTEPTTEGVTIAEAAGERQRPITTLAAGEEDPPVTTLAIGEEDPDITTMAVGEEEQLKA
jgi:hypothetical protein